MKRIEIARIVLLACLGLSPSLLMAQAGSLDPTFGTGGIATTPNTNTGCGAVVSCVVAIQSDGKIVVAGAATVNQAPEMALARYKTNGSLDLTFGRGGIVLFGESNGGPAFGLAIQLDGKIVTAAPTNLGLDVFRFNSNGTLDSTFGTGGIVATRAAGLLIGDTPGGLALMSNGDIVVAVGASLLRFLPNGQFDSSFGSGGVAPLLSGPLGLALTSTGKLLVTSAFTFTTGSADQYNANGSVDGTFGVFAQAPSVGEPAAIAPLSNGKLIVVGTIDSAARRSGQVTPTGFVLTRYNSNGTIDVTFGTRGAVVTNFPGNTDSAALAVAVQTNGDIVAAGTTALNGLSTFHFALARYTPNGQLDATFGHNGLVITALGTNGANNALISALAIQSDGKIVAVGSNAPPNFSDPNPGFTLARYLGQ